MTIEQYLIVDLIIREEKRKEIEQNGSRGFEEIKKRLDKQRSADNADVQ